MAPTPGLEPSTGTAALGLGVIVMDPKLRLSVTINEHIGIAVIYWETRVKCSDPACEDDRSRDRLYSALVTDLLTSAYHYCHPSDWDQLVASLGDGQLRPAAQRTGRHVFGKTTCITIQPGANITMSHPTVPSDKDSIMFTAAEWDELADLASAGKLDFEILLAASQPPTS